jgi:hypothetical protein
VSFANREVCYGRALIEFAEVARSFDIDVARLAFRRSSFASSSVRFSLSSPQFVTDVLWFAQGRGSIARRLESFARRCP